MNQLFTNHASGNIIGFASEFYTLWRLDCEPYFDSQGRLLGYHWRGTFIKNVAKDIARVRELFPDLEIDTSLRGHHSFNTFEAHKEVFPDDVFGFGKYKGQYIESCTDVEYLHWAWDGDYLTDANKVHAAVVLNQAGYHIIDGFLYSASQYDTLMQHREFENTINAGNPFNVLFESSLNNYGQYFFRGQVLNFKDYKTMYYNGYEYGLPIVNGKTKRIKGKTFRILSYNLKEDGIEVTKMEIVK